MLEQVKTIKCTRVVVQVSMGFYDAEGNLLREELFPQSEGRVVGATLFHPHPEQLRGLIELCVGQGYAKLAAEAAAETPGAGPDGAGVLPPGEGAFRSDGRPEDDRA